jgi:hypothetical protein
MEEFLPLNCYDDSSHELNKIPCNSKSIILVEKNDYKDYRFES